jgi:coiled-coil domain-containing protein 151
LNDGSSKFVE